MVTNQIVFADRRDLLRDAAYIQQHVVLANAQDINQNTVYSIPFLTIRNV